jgi:hypothetical protein
MLPQSIAGLNAGRATELVLERLPSGELAWLRLEPECYVLTDLSRRVLAMDALFGPWPTVAQASA